MVKNTRSLVYRIYQRYLKNNPNLKEEGFRLPKIVEWQFMIKDQFLFENQDDLGDYAWLSFNSHHKIHPVKSKKANQLGFYDVYGHVWEWCSNHKHLYHTTLKRNSFYDILNNPIRRRQQLIFKTPKLYTFERVRYRSYDKRQFRLEAFWYFIKLEKNTISEWMNKHHPCLLGYSYASPMYSIFRDQSAIGEIGTFNYRLVRHMFYRHPSYGLRLARTNS